MNDHIESLIVAQDIIPSGEKLSVSMELKQHEMLCLIGPDSLRLCKYLRVLAGVETAEKGELRLLGSSVRTLDRKNWRAQRQHIGYVARNAPILSVLRGIDNVMLPVLYHKRMTREEAEARATELITQVGFSGSIHELPAYFTQQERLQLAIARAKILEPVMLFVEMPFASLSLAEQKPIYHYLMGQTSELALAVATHNLRLAKESATQILFLGEQHAERFNSWQELNHCPHEEVISYLQQYQQQYQTGITT